MAKLTTLLHFSSVKDLTDTYGAILPKPYGDWRLILDPCVGQINGLPTLRGICVATNGIMCALINEQSQITFGHVDFFVPDVESNETFKAKVLAKTPTKKEPKVDISEFV